MLDVTGCARLFRGERRLVQRVGLSLKRLGFECRLAMAPTCGLAWAVARYGLNRGTIVHEDRLLETLRPLPTPALRLDEDTVAALAEVNIDRVEHLLALPRPALAERFGGELLMRLDQATGQAFEPILPVRPAQPLTVTFAFDGPAKQFEAIVEATRQLLAQLCGRLEQREAGAAAIRAVYERPDHRVDRIELVLGRPTRRLRHLWLLLRPRLDRLDVENGIDRIDITADRIARLPHHQSETWGETRGADRLRQEQFARLIDVLSNRLGAERVWRLQPTESHQPRRAFRLRPAGEPVTRDEQRTRIGESDRPSVLFDRPEPVRVIAPAPDGPPHRVRWRNVDYGVLAALGPERIDGEWWAEQPAAPSKEPAGEAERPDAERHEPVCSSFSSDFFKVQLHDGRWVWLARTATAGGSRWSVQGEWA